MSVQEEIAIVKNKIAGTEAKIAKCEEAIEKAEADGDLEKLKNLKEDWKILMAVYEKHMAYLDGLGLNSI